MASIYLAQAIKYKHIHIKGLPDRYRDFVYIDDVVDAFEKCIRDERSGSYIYNVCTGEKTSVKVLVDKIIGELPFEVSVDYSGVRLVMCMDILGIIQKLILY